MTLLESINFGDCFLDNKITDSRILILLTEMCRNCKKEKTCKGSFSLIKACTEFDLVDFPKERFKILLNLTPKIFF